MDQSKEFTLQVLGAHVVELAAARVRNAQLEQQAERAPYYCDECKMLVFGEHRAQNHEAK